MYYIMGIKNGKRYAKMAFSYESALIAFGEFKGRMYDYISILDMRRLARNARLIDLVR